MAPVGVRIEQRVELVTTVFLCIDWVLLDEVEVFENNPLSAVVNDTILSKEIRFLNKDKIAITVTK